jgi:hypothetical protein
MFSGGATGNLRGVRLSLSCVGVGVVGFASLEGMKILAAFVGDGVGVI